MVGLVTFIRQSSTMRAKLIARSAVSAVPLPEPVKKHQPQQAHLRKWLPNRCGAVTQKVGMMPYFDEKTGERIAATILQFNNVEVLMHRRLDEDGYVACQVGYGNRSVDKVSRQMLGHFATLNVNPKEKVTEFRVKNEEGLLPIGTHIKPDFFTEGQYLDVRSVSKGKGFAGVMKRHNFKGLRASHGTSVMHRHGGSYGQNQDPGRVLPGKKMPGHMGVQNVTVQNVKILKVDEANNVIWVKGAVPGPNGTYVKIQDAIKKLKD
ncbi:uncharacterized protein GVI51_B02057 [Nakaseomyces glabratus]|uniref:Large ribosomal subunit protein uL3m n=2 Tax=Candida glabrata TaxID=5478 RepID=Q6FXB8_CANGA|nr:mitochondrial 54S ribosomal protein YmL9 [Nakaseomyces glabratus]KAH7609096.1 Ribosomal protein L3 [Nakaseomyces glabratus]KAH7609971.1 Ribosomal protein L3 [Nakaseomyces glabratus]KAI8390466.1 Ribosomal protein L3 [Nakaseomyces glabratus]KAJ9570839.1 54S ribosomal protein L9, mitochondrial [Nakaseomyces glabratus]KTB03911.1 54S ribosomal protein L9, mitochondrial [Nakaseomyces glabratus]|eukprot:XP_445064.1 mitochondrial 54S ribosomal protein YmL9 [[Candida] glabrata]